MKLKLTIEPRPVSTWGITLANRLDKKEWDEIRHKVYFEANYACQICGRTDSKLFCHEVWRFDDRRRIQQLAGFECLCEPCSDVKHFGRSSQVYGGAYQKKLTEHWCRVNGKTRADFERHLAEIRTINRKRADKQYIVKVGRRVLV